MPQVGVVTPLCTHPRGVAQNLFLKNLLVPTLYSSPGSRFGRWGRSFTHFDQHVIP
jgi:hypothetical protein